MDESPFFRYNICMSLTTKILIVLFPIIVYVVLWLIFHLLRLKRYTKVHIIDIWTLFLIYGLVIFIKKATSFSFLPYYLMLISAIALVLLILDLFYYQKFKFSKFFKRWWRILYLVTVSMYFCLIIAVLFLN